ncbi:transmembrane protein 256 homolog [Daktulosphaira vitifoliae]|uniref:transmembrane protein 256 homolog n=1 Tax=Daktulosphaira vitifoliae TaxID=58002 RepID=UPI0021AA66AA|nr:transmembrane protein 256 homolog [Daktulosphaira vitifoliae]
MNPDSLQEAVKWVAYKNPVVTNSIHGFNSMLHWIGLTSGSEQKNLVKMDSRSLIQLIGKNIYFYKIAGVLGASALILGAYGAHVVSHKATPEEAKNFETGNRLHFYHTLALFVVPFCRFPVVTGSLFISGTILFCGTCYYNGLTGDKSFNKLAPTGGMLLISAWLSMLI